MFESVTSKGVDFIRRQHRAFKVNMVRNLVYKFSIGLTQQYQSIYVSALGAGAVELGLVNSVGGIASTLCLCPSAFRAPTIPSLRLSELKDMFSPARL